MKPSETGDKKPTSAFGARISELRQAAGLTMTMLAEQVGVSEAYVSMLESGGRRPSRKVIEKLVAVFQNESTPLLRDHLLVLAQHDPLSEAKTPQNSHYEKLLQHTPGDDFHTFLALVNSLIRQGQFALAQSRIETGFKHFQKTAQLQMLVAYLELSRGNHDAGIVAMEAAIQSKKQHPSGENTSMAELLLNLGVLHFFKGSTCLLPMHEAISRQDTTEAADQRHKALSSFAQARSFYQQGLTLEPEHISLRDELARVCFNLADLHTGKKAQTYWRESIQAFQTLLAAPHKDQLEEDVLLESSCFLAHAYTKAGHLSQARQTLDVITACRPRHAFAYYVLACHYALSEAESLPMACLYLHKALTLNPQLKGQARLDPDLQALRQQLPQEWSKLLQ